MQIRKATRDDAARIAEVHVNAWREGYKGIMPDEYLDSLSIDLRIEQWQEILLKKNSGVNLIIEHNDVVSGFGVYGPARDEDLSNCNAGELVALNILPSAWNIGLGRALINEIIASSCNNNWKSLYLWVIKENNRARKLYESMGFKVDGIEKIDSSLIGCQLNEVRYVKYLLN